MSIETTIIEALQASHSAHRSGLEALAKSQSRHQAALEEIAALERAKTALEHKVAALETRVTHLEAESVKIVEPGRVGPHLVSLAQAIAATQDAVSTKASDETAPADVQPARAVPLTEAAAA